MSVISIYSTNTQIQDHITALFHQQATPQTIGRRIAKALQFHSFSNISKKL